MLLLYEEVGCYHNMPLYHRLYKAASEHPHHLFRWLIAVSWWLITFTREAGQVSVIRYYSFAVPIHLLNLN
jgi:hypothetical protein